MLKTTKRTMPKLSINEKLILNKNKLRDDSNPYHDSIVCDSKLQLVLATARPNNKSFVDY
jgi:hypothetical protein